LSLGGTAGRRNDRYVSKEGRIATTTFFVVFLSSFGGFFAFIANADIREWGAGLVNDK
jgi:hypothetical protein